MSEIDFGGYSPYTTRNEITGGTIASKKSDFAKWLLIGAILVIVLYLIYSLYHKIILKGETYEQKQTRVFFDRIHGEAFDDDAKRVITFGESIETPRAIDHYRLGTVYLVNANNPHKAHDHFRRALNQVIDKKVDPREAVFIIDRIDDYRDNFTEFPEIEDELPIQEAMLAHYQAMTKQFEVNHRRKLEIHPGDKDFTQKIILSRQKWQTDSQNVHDSAVYAELSDQFVKSRADTSRMKDKSKRNFDEIRDWMRANYIDQPKKLASILKTLEVLDNNYEISNIAGGREQDLITEVWRRAHLPINENNKRTIQQALAEALVDCVEGGHVVCLAGRTAKIWAALALLDKDPEMGVIRTKQALRNEIYDKAAKVVDNYIGEKGSVSSDLKNAYNKGENTAQVQELIECMIKDIEKIKEPYVGLLPEEQLNLLIEECKSVV